MTVSAAADATTHAERDDFVAPRSFARIIGRIAIYALLIIWTFIALFPIYWTLSTSMKNSGVMLPKAISFHGLTSCRVGRDGNRSAFRPTRFSTPRTYARSSSINSSTASSVQSAPPPSPLSSAPLLLTGSVVSTTSSARGGTRTSPSSSSPSAHPASGGSRVAISRPLQGTGAARHADRPHPRLHIDGAADRDLGDARSVRHHPDGDGAGGACRRLHDLGRVPPHRPPHCAAGHGRGVHSLARPLLERVLLRFPPDRI